MKKPFGIAGFGWLFLFLCCSPSNESLQKTLEKQADSDLKDILEEMKQNGIDSLKSDNPYFEIAGFTVFHGDTARRYRAHAVVHFYYLKSIKLYQIRKFRYQMSGSFWDRYDIKLKHLYKKINIDSLKAQE